MVVTLFLLTYRLAIWQAQNTCSTIRVGSYKQTYAKMLEKVDIEPYRINGDEVFFCLSV